MHARGSMNTRCFASKTSTYVTNVRSSSADNSSKPISMAASVKPAVTVGYLLRLKAVQKVIYAFIYDITKKLELRTKITRETVSLLSVCCNLIYHTLAK